MINFCNALNNSISLQVHAHWEPIADSTFNMHKSLPEHVELFDLAPNQPIKEYRVEAFHAFLPPSTVSVGDVWKLDANRVVSFLRQFHPGATANLGYGEEGAFACLTRMLIRLCRDCFPISCGIHVELCCLSEMAKGKR